jgi:hypothetical protein
MDEGRSLSTGRSLAKPSIACALAAAVVLLSPGLSCYEAIAAEIHGKGAPAAGIKTSAAPAGLSLPRTVVHGPQATRAGVPSSADSTVAPAAGAATGVSSQESGAAQADVVPVAAADATAADAESGDAARAPVAAAELGQQLSQEQKVGRDGGSLLSRAFDKLRRRRGGSVDPSAVAGSESAPAKSGLVPAAPGETAAKTADVPAPASAASVAASPAAGLGARLKNFASTFALTEFNKSEKAYIIAQALFMFAITVYMTSLPFVVQAITGDISMTGAARAVHFWSLGAAALAVTPIVKRTRMMSMLRPATFARAAAFGTIGLLLMTSAPSWPLFLGIVALNAFVVSMTHLLDIDADGARKVFDSDKKIENAGYVTDKAYYFMMFASPWIVGKPLDWVISQHGLSFGAGIGYVVFGVLTIGAFFIYRYVKPINEAVSAARWATMRVAKRGVVTYRLARLLARRTNVRIGVAMVALGGAVAVAAGLGLIAGGLALALPAALVAAMGIIAAFHLNAVRAIFGNRAVMTQATMATVENFLEDALFWVVVPTFAIGVLKLGAEQNQMLSAAAMTGGLLGGWFMRKYAQRIQENPNIGTYGFLKILTAVAAFAFVPSMALWAFPTGFAFVSPFFLAMGAVFALKLMYQPLRSRMRALLQVSIKADPKARAQSENIFGLMGFFQVLSAGAGGIVFSWLFTHQATMEPIIGALAPMKIVTAMLMLMSVIYVAGLFWIKKQLVPPAAKKP